MTSLSCKNWLKDILLLTLIIGSLYAIFLGSRPLAVPDEARYVEIPREMLVTGDFVTPRLDFIKYFEKPPLLYWLQAGFMKAFGFNEWAWRLPTMLLALFGCLMTYAAGRQLFDRRTGWLAALILASNLLYFVMGHLITLDMTVSVCISATLLAFLTACQLPPGWQRRLLMWLMYAFAAGGTLTKGLIGFVLPGGVIFFWLLLFKQWRQVKHCYLISGLLLFFALTVPWHALAQLNNPEFLHFYFIEQQFLRFSTLAANRYQPVWWFIPILLLGFYPWTTFLFQALVHQVKALKQHWHEKAKIGFLLIWVILIFVFFSFSKSKLIPYILPIFPALALLCGNYLAQYCQKPLSKGVKIGLSLLPIVAIGLGIASLWIIANLNEETDLALVKHYLYGITLFSIVGALATCFTVWRFNLAKGLICLAVSSMMFVNLGLLSLPHIDNRSIKPLTDVLKPILQSDDEVVAFNDYFQDLPVYLQRRITLINIEDELLFGMQHQNTQDWVIPEGEFWQRWFSNKRIYVVVSLDHYPKLQAKAQTRLHVVAKTGRNVLVTNLNVN